MLKSPRILPYQLLLAVAAPALAQEVTLHGQIRPRYEFTEPAPSGGERFTSMRSRLGLDAALERDVRVFVQLQDVRFWGEETNTLSDFNADNLDLHQGFVEIGRFADARAAVRIGRQEINLGGQRLIGAVGWTQQGRSFDGVRLRLNSDMGCVDLIGYRLSDRVGAQQDQDAQLLGAYAVVDAGRTGSVDLYALYQKRVGATETRQGTFGVRFVGSQGRVTFRGEASLQRGERADADVAAYMLGGRIGYQVGDRSTLMLWYDHLSGDDDLGDGETRVFDTMFATNHKFYGLADLFLNIPAHTADRGLEDLALKGSHGFGSAVSVGLDLHSFRLTEQGTLASAHLGEELDAWVAYAYSGNVTVQGGLSLIRPDHAWADIGRLTEDMSLVYVMINSVF